MFCTSRGILKMPDKHYVRTVRSTWHTLKMPDKHYVGTVRSTRHTLKMPDKHSIGTCRSPRHVQTPLQTPLPMYLTQMTPAGHRQSASRQASDHSSHLHE